MSQKRIHPIHYILAWLTHAITASGAIWGLFALKAISQQQLIPAFWYMAAAIFIDAIDGTLARKVNIKQLAPKIDGTTLDNIIDYLNYAIVPAYFLLESNLIPKPFTIPLAILIVITSAYQFSQTDAKTEDHFFKGFPSYWNLAVFYMFLWGLTPTINTVILLLLGLLIFVPIKYVYPSRLEFLTHQHNLRQLMLVSTILWGIASIWLLWIYPRTSVPVTMIMLAYTLLYVSISLYRTFVPLSKNEPTLKNKKFLHRFFPSITGR